MKYEDSRKMAEAHVEWFLNMIKPIFVEHMMHGYKHGYEDCFGEKVKK